jgi:hypothetical protein
MIWEDEMQHVPETQDEIQARVLQRFPEERGVDVVEGPHGVGPYHMARIWTRAAGGEYHAHYYVRQGDNVLLLHNFSPFAVWLAGEWRDLEIFRHSQRLDWARTSIAGVLLVGSLGLVAYGFVKTPDVSKFVETLISGVLLAAAGYLFGSATRTKAARQTGP